SDMLHCSSNVNAKTVVTYHSDIIRQKKLMVLYNPLMKIFFNRVDRIVATSPNYFATSSVLNNFKEKVEVISLGIDDASYPKINSQYQKRLNDQLGKDFFLFVGVLRYYKGLNILIDALKKSQLKAVIAGAGPVENELKERVKKLGLKNIIFLGHVSDQEKVSLIELSRAIIFPSYLRSEAFGMTLIEGAMLGKPLISTEIGTGTSYVNLHNETGLVISPGCPEELKNAMEYLYQNPDIALKMGKAARKRYLSLFTGKLMGKHYADLYTRLFTNQKV
ncbi:MAG: glycosyltransferase, partial [Proteobacteria bacterium]|nr:glycosyltransferase [Pseudomonadota bacterium]